MNIFLIPYNAFRHFHVALFTGAAALLAWWLVLSYVVLSGPSWSADWDGSVLLGAVSAATAGASLMAEGGLLRDAPGRRALKVLMAAALAGGGAALLVRGWEGVMGSFGADAADPTLVSLRYEIGAFALGGLACGAGALAPRRGQGWLFHLAGGLSAGLAGAAVWHTLGHYEIDRGNDLYLASGLMSLTWGVVFGLLTWGIPDRLYAGWLRVLSPERFGRRIPIDALDGTQKERFVGHFPRGLDLWLGAQEGVQELHISVAVDEKQRYIARGLSLHPTRVRRFLEKIDLRYDPRRPHPLNTRLHSGDRVEMGDGQSECVVEFLMLPREER